jgi:hypothetical protein
MFSWIRNWFTEDSTTTAGESITTSSGIGSDDDGCTVNPATGLPMIDGCASVDVAGNPFGTDLNDWSGSSGLDDSWSSTDDWSSSSTDDWSGGGFSSWED